MGIITPSKSQEQQWNKHKQECLIRYYVSNPELAKAKLKKMDRKIKRDSKGKVSKRDMDKFNKMELFRDKLNIERNKRRAS